MKAIVNGKDIVRAISRINPFLNLNPSHYQANVKICCNSTGIIITGLYNNYKIVSCAVCDCEQDGSLVVNFEKFEKVVKRHKKEKLTLYDDKNTFYINYGRGVVKLGKICVDEYQETKINLNSVHNIILPKYWDKIVKKVLSLVVENFRRYRLDFKKYWLTGIYFEIGPEGMCVTSTTGLVLTHIESVDVTLPKNIKFIVPKFTLKEVLENKCDEMKVDDNHICFINSKDGTEIISPFIEGPYPNYHNFIPYNLPYYAVINRESLISSIDSLLLFTYGKITFSFDDILVMEAKSTDNNTEVTEKLPIQFYGNPLCMAFNSDNIKDILNMIDDDTVIWYMGSPDKPCIIKPKNTIFVDEIYSVVPLRL